MYEVPFDVADIQVERATVVKPKVVATLVKRADNPVLITGGNLLTDEKLLKYAIEIYDKGIPIIATGASSKPLIQNKVKVESAVFTLHHITQYMLDKEWQGFNGKSYDVVLYLGIEPYHLSRMLSALKHFSNIMTLNIDRYYQPHAKFSFPNLFEEEHYRMLEELISEL
jgi:acetyl-CoA decarbonylase/synthase complex subunit epsilon